MQKAKKVGMFLLFVWGSVVALKFITQKIPGLPAVLKI